MRREGSSSPAGAGGARGDVDLVPCSGAGDGDGRATGKVQDILEIHICIS